jgi:hypothetical protein
LTAAPRSGKNYEPTSTPQEREPSEPTAAPPNRRGERSWRLRFGEAEETEIRRRTCFVPTARAPAALPSSKPFPGETTWPAAWVWEASASTATDCLVIIFLGFALTFLAGEERNRGVAVRLRVGPTPFPHSAACGACLLCLLFLFF